MARHVWSVLCRKTLTDTANPSLMSLIELVDGITVHRSTPDEDLTKVGSLNYECRLVSNWIRSNRDEPEWAVARFGLILPDGTKANYSDDMRFDMTELARARTYVNLAVLPLHGEGCYEFLVELKRGDEWEEVARLPVDINLAQDG